MAGRNRKGQFTKGHTASRAKTRTVKTIVVRRSASPAVRHVKVTKRRHHSKGMFGGGLIGRLVPDRQDIEQTIGGGLFGFVVKGYKAGDKDSIAYKIADAAPKFWEAGGLIGNLTILATGIAAATNHPYAKAAKRAGMTITAYEWMKRGGGAATADSVEGYGGNAEPEPDGNGGGTDSVQGWADPDSFDQQQQ